MRISIEDLKKDLTGRIISLDQTKCKRFSCGGFSVNIHNPSAVIMPDAQQEQIRHGLLDGRLIDITDQNTNGLVEAGIQHTKPGIEDTGEKVYITIDSNGAMSIAIPTNQAEQDKFEQKIKEDGVLILESPKISEHISPLVAGRTTTSSKFNILENFSQAVVNIKRSQ